MAKKKKKKIKAGFEISLETTPFHVLFFAAYPLILLYMVNAKEMYAYLLIKPMFISILAASALYCAVLFMVKNALKAGFMTSVFIIWFFTYGHLYRSLEAPLKLTNHFVLFPMTMALAGAVIAFVARLRIKNTQTPEKINLILNYVAIGLVLFVTAAAILRMPEQGKIEPVKQLTETAAPSSADEKYPDIYYIIMDGHARSDYMKKTFNYDDSVFIDKMRSMGFYIPAKAKANYPETLLSFASFLNCDYLDKLIKLDPASDDRVVVKDQIKKKSALGYLKDKGYTVIIFPSINVTNAMKAGADYIMTPAALTFGEFEYMIFSTSVISAVSGFFHEGEPPAYQARRESIRYDFKYIPETAKMGSPKVVFAHIVCPHPPFVFDAQGGAVINTKPINFADGDHSDFSTEEYVEKYGAQARFIDDMTVKMVENLMKNMKKNSIIIIHGDHGSGSHLNWEDYTKTDFGERLSIFSAYYLPGGGDKLLYPGISPVNNFRLIQKFYFGEKINLLPDKSYFSKWDKPYDFIDVTKYTQ